MNAQPVVGGWRQHWPLLLILGLCLPGWLLRASYDNSLWMDELYSLRLVVQPVPDLIDATRFDAHPPGYYLLLKGWIAIGEAIWGQRGVGLFWARLSSIIALTALVLVGWFGGRRALGPLGGGFIAALLGLNAFLALVGPFLRNYPWVLLGLTTCFLVLLVLWQEDGDQPPTRDSWSLAALYALAASFVLYLHLLAALVLTMLGLAWIAIVATRRGRLLTPLRLGLGLAQAVAAIAFVPWLLQLRYQLSYLQNTPTPWMTPATPQELASVFFYWMPWGMHPTVEGGWLTAMWVGGGVAMACALMAALPWKRAPLAPAMRRALALGLWVGAGYIITIWSIAALDIAKVFHASRYTVLGAPMLMAAVAAGTAARGWRVGLLALAPLLILSAFGTAGNLRREGGGGVGAMLRELGAPVLPPEGERLYVLGYDLAPYMKEPLRGFELRPIADVVSHPADSDSISILATDPWQGVWPFHERLALAKIATAGFSESRSDRTSGDQRIFRFDGLNREHWAAMFDPARQPRFAEARGAVSTAAPETQRARDGWSLLEFGSDFSTFRWSTEQRTVLRFDRQLEAGEYVIRLAGFRQPYPTSEATLVVGMGPSPLLSTQRPAGAFELTIPLRLDAPAEELELWVDCPTWVPADHFETADSRRLGFLFSGAWVVPARP